MKLNVSAAKTFLNDQTDWYYAYVLRRVPRRLVPALGLGTLWHVLLETLAKTGSREAAKDAAQHEIDNLISLANPGEIEDFLKDTEQLFRLFDAYRERERFDETLLVESALEVPLPDSHHVLLGRPDRVVRHGGKLWHVQNRTLSDRTPIAVYLAAAERDLHELAYAYLICSHFGEPLSDYGGTYMNIARKVSKKRLAEDPQSAFVQEFIPIAPDQVHVALSDLRQIGDDMEVIIAGSRSPTQNRELDKGRFGNRLSDYFMARMGRVSIMDDAHFMDAESRYDSEPAVVSE